MSFRISLYCVPKDVVNRYRNITNEEYKVLQDYDNDYVLDELRKEQIAYDFLTDMILDNSKDDKVVSRLFKNKIDDEIDYFFGTMNKEQLINLIKLVKEKVTKYYIDRSIDRDKLESSEEGIVQIVKDNQYQWNIMASRWLFETTINWNQYNKWLVSNSSLYEYTIFDLVHILKIFDWEHDEIVVIGC